MAVFFTCDDVGATETLTQRCLEGWRAGILDAFAVMPNGLASGTLAEALAQEPERPLRVSVHLNLSDGPPCADPSLVPSLLGPEGRLGCGFGKSLLRSSLWGSRAFVEQVEVEWRAQIAAVQRIVGERPIAAVDGHCHVHMLPGLFPLAARLAREAGIGAIRVSAEVPHLSRSLGDSLSPAFPLNVVKHLVLRACALPARRAARRAAVSHPASILGVLYTGRMSSTTLQAGLAATRRRLPGDEVEVVVHVGRAEEEELRAYCGRGATSAFASDPARDREYAGLEHFRAAAE